MALLKTLCEKCADLLAVCYDCAPLGGDGACTQCGAHGAQQYELTPKKKRGQKSSGLPARDTRAQYRPPFREGM